MTDTDADTPGIAGEDAVEDAADDTADRPAATSSTRSGRDLDKLAELEEERRYLLRSLKDLENEHVAGDVDDVDYETLRDGYTVRAASVLRQIETGRRALAPRQPRNWKRTIVVSLAMLAFAIAITAALASAFGERGANEEITGFSPADDVRTTLANARAALNVGEFIRARELFVEADQAEVDRGRPNAEARAYVGWTTFFLARQTAGDQPIDQRLLDASLLALDQAIEIDPTFADPYCFAAIIEFNFNDDAGQALPFVDQCEALNPPADVAGLVSAFADEIRASTTE